MNNGVVAGVDLGTAAIKVVFIGNNNQLLWSKVIPATIESVETANRILGEGLMSLGLPIESDLDVAATGYGKRVFNHKHVSIDEISALAVGANVLSGGRARTIINIGGQDTKIVSISETGKLKDFKMNEKCAAGTGRFFEMVSRVLNVPIDKLGDMFRSDAAALTINNTCAVFAESEIVSLLYKNVSKEEIIGGVYCSMARRIVDFIGRFEIEREVYLDGGPARNKGLLAALKKELMLDISVLPQHQFTTAAGAAIILAHRLKFGGSTVE